MTDSIVTVLQNIKSDFLQDKNVELAIQNILHTFEKFQESRFDVAYTVFEDQPDFVLELTKQEFKNYFSNIENNYNILGKSDEFLNVVALQVFELSKNTKELSFLIMDMFKKQTSQHFSESVEKIALSKIENIIHTMLQNGKSFSEIELFYQTEYKDTYYEKQILKLINNIQ
tara:strand:- start:14059 stop:14574 length:516 start_codon:yes stop_codon:yes gene_type:complete